VQRLRITRSTLGRKKIIRSYDHEMIRCVRYGTDIHSLGTTVAIAFLSLGSCRLKSRSKFKMTIHRIRSCYCRSRQKSVTTGTIPYKLVESLSRSLYNNDMIHREWNRWVNHQRH
jgi:glycine cleavage system protein P-like pyridoxal-binding family